MRFLAVDDEPYALEDLEAALRAAAPGNIVAGYTSPRRALEDAAQQTVDIAFLDIELGSTNGILLAKELKDLQPRLHIVFVTSHAQYAVDAFAIHATGYLLKPVLPEDVARELTFLYGERKAPPEKAVRVQTFGGFSVYVAEKPLLFRRAKAKELLAYLVDRRGAAITTREACAVLWEEGPYDTARKNYFQSVLWDLCHTLKAAGVEDILVRKRNSFAVNTARIDCDSYRFMAGDPQAVNQYRSDYLPCYSWAEFTVPRLEDE